MMIDKVIEYTRDTMGASDAALGNVTPDNTSAIIAVQKATSMPLELQRQDFYCFVEDSVRIWMDMMAQNYGVRMVRMKAPRRRRKPCLRCRTAWAPGCCRRQRAARPVWPGQCFSRRRRGLQAAFRFCAAKWRVI
ncbi:MAG: hypothetical protein ACLSBB_02370 [Ruthenibacterium lactatiformans]